MEINNETQRLQSQAVSLLETIEDTAEYFCDEHFISGEQFYVMIKALCDAKLKDYNNKNRLRNQYINNYQ